MVDDFNICCASDSYKFGHYLFYLKNTEMVYSYFEARNGAKFNKTVFYGLQYILKKYFCGQVVTKENIDEGQWYIDQHLGPGIFNRQGWEYIVEKYNGYLPIKIKAVPEGTSVEISNIMMSVENTDPNCAWLTNFLETELLHIWYTSAVATLSRECKIMLKDYWNKTTDFVYDPNLIGPLDYTLHDFGYRGSTCYQSAMMAGSAHLINFLGTDTVPALRIPIKYYNYDKIAGHSVQATEHSIMTSRMEEGEWDVVKNIFENAKSGILSLVIDSYDYERFINKLGTDLKYLVDNHKGTVVFRPDSGEPESTTLNCIETLGKHFGYTVNKKGFKVLPSNVRVLWGDGIDYYGIRGILFTLMNNNWSSENLVFGMGGGLHQKVERDTQKFAFKSSAQYYDGQWNDVYKRPKDLTKASKRGRLALIKEDDKFVTVREDQLNCRKDYLEVVYENGKMVKEYTWEQVRLNASI